VPGFSSSRGGQIELKDSAPSGIRRRPQAAPVRLDDRPTDRQSNAHTTGLSRVECVEHVLESGWRQSRTRISHGNEHAV
jgi:hypothetical protein